MRPRPARDLARQRAEQRFGRSLRLLEWFGDLVLLNLLWLLASLAVLTAFAATAAAYAVVLSWLRGDDRSPLRAFRSEMIALLVAATVLGLAWSALVALLALDLALALQMPDGVRTVVLAGLTVVVAAVTAVSPWLVPALVRGHRGRRLLKTGLAGVRSCPLHTLGCLALGLGLPVVVVAMPALVVVAPGLALLAWVRLTSSDRAWAD